MRILLLNPPCSDNRSFIREGRCNQEQGAWSTQWPPISLAFIGAVLEKEGHNVEIIDCAVQPITRKKTLAYIEKEAFNFVIWSTGTPTIDDDLFFATEIKAIQPDSITVVFGTHVSALTEKCLSSTKGLDVIIRNEPEETIEFLVRNLSQKNNIQNIDGISYKDKAGNIIHNPARKFVSNLDEFPFPAWHLIDLDMYRLPLSGNRFVIVAPIRGCPYLCNFCTSQTYYGRKLRKRSISVVLNEIEYCIRKFQINEFFIWADTFTADKKYVLEFCKQLKERSLNINWTCNSRIDTVDLNMLNQMAEAGCWMISYGFESGNQAILDSINKNILIDQFETAVNYTCQAGIKISGHFILGLPGETENTIQETLKLALKLDIDIAQFYSAVPFPGSKLYQVAESQGWITNQKFTDFRQDNAVMDLPTVSPKRVEYYRKIAYRKFYFRPIIVWKLLKLLKLSQVVNTMFKIIQFWRWSK
jgi:anaerobic magnesium-protoporphyrin IX monomethyl ester cyclase